ncbi:MAG: tRNA (adenosine(37)-N6)-threonylcarbamoyltransferase complex transferase subunit TsaD [Nitrospirae bacterium]|nr:tRNA (adenosine(37)-N6)-threonylcarbamoyltransferase complex transferase subunit TsaD [Nitrospirota bacterium]MDE3049319.1 tRNA (adenosine(37)-N6)-threonylcarbamoyltransferase complex transferase subunit TsaD [Nitrospirota bacterium]
MVTTAEQPTAAWIPGPILGIETSCDETAASVLAEDGAVLSNIITSQHAVHQRFGGVVPELASRAHIESIEDVSAEALQQAGLSWTDLTGIAVTQGPGLAGALLVGVNFAKALAYALNIPVVGVSHLEGHIASAWLQDPAFPLPCVVLVVSGGHTHLYYKAPSGLCRLLGATRDDAAGEAFDKGAQMLGLEYPGGPSLDRLAQQGNRDSIAFPRSYLKKGSLDFSFSGLKTALLYTLQAIPEQFRAQRAADFAASYQEAIVTVLVDKAFAAARSAGAPALAVVGGVSANSRLRMLLQQRAASENMRLSLPSLAYCTDNAAMIAAAGRQTLRFGHRATLDLDAQASMMSPFAHAI